MNAYLIALVAVLLNTAAQLLLKATTNAVGVIAFDGSFAASATRVLQVPWFYAGMTCYAVSVVVWMSALSRVPVSVAYPLLSVGYIVNAILAHFLFGESLTMQKCVGIGFIIIGVVLLVRN